MDENDKIQHEVEKKKQRAKDLGLPDLISDLYMNHIRYFPSWIKNNREYVPDMVKNCAETDNKEIMLELNDKKYFFRFKETTFDTPDGEWHTHGDLELYLHDDKYFAISLAQESNEYCSSWKAFDVNAFKEKEWINDFKVLKKQIDIDSKAREEKIKNDPVKINKLKTDFDIN